MEKEWKKELILFFQGMGMGINSFFKSRNEEWELIPFFEWEWEWDYNPKNEGMDPCLHNCNYSTSSVSSSATDYQHSRRAVLAWAVGPCGVVLKGLKDSTRRYANYAVESRYF